MVELSGQEAQQACRCWNEPCSIDLSPNQPGKGNPQPTLTPNFLTYTGTLPRTTPNIFDSNVQALRSLMLSPILRRNGFIHTQSGSIPRNTRISLLYGIKRLIPLFCSVSRWNQSSWVDNSLKGGPNASNNESSWVHDSGSGEPNAANKES